MDALLRIAITGPDYVAVLLRRRDGVPFDACHTDKRMPAAPMLVHSGSFIIARGGYPVWIIHRLSSVGIYHLTYDKTRRDFSIGKGMFGPSFTPEDDGWVTMGSRDFPAINSLADQLETLADTFMPHGFIDALPSTVAAAASVEPPY